MVVARVFLLGFAGAVLAGCASTPPTAVQQPMSVRPAPRAEIVAAPGSIFQAQNGRGLFDDRRASHVGDTLTINIVERNTASAASSSTAERSASASAGVGTMAGLPGKSVLGLGLDASSDNSFEGSGESAANNVFTGTITVTVIDLLPNGNLMVSGEKQVAINQGNEFIRFSGVVNPATVTTANTVNSSQVADARIEYKGSGYINESQQMGWLARFFLNVLPF
jgi:flagellar L-ring protein precursor FlgH